MLTQCCTCVCATSLTVLVATAACVQTHVCILQTTIDLLNRGINVYIVADAVSSQRQFDRSVALKVSGLVTLLLAAHQADLGPPPPAAPPLL